MINERQEPLKTLRAVPVVARALAEPFDDDTIRQRPVGGEWAAIEVLGHMADADERGLARIERMLAEDNPELPGFDQAALVAESRHIDGRMMIELDRLEAAVTVLVARLAGLDDAGWQRTGRHAEHGPITVASLVAHTTGQDVDHLAQIARGSRRTTRMP